MNKVRAVFFDKDGTLIEDVPYNVNPNLIKLREDAGEALLLLREAGFKLFIISNQSGVARGLFEEKDLQAVWDKLNELTGIEFDGFYYCPHFTSGKVEKYSFACDCRKPAPGLILQAALAHNIDLTQSWMVGDTMNDIEAGQRAGCQTILLGSSARSLIEAVGIITGQNHLR